MSESGVKYDENLQENKFFAALLSKHKDLWKDALKRKLWILVPQSSSLKELKKWADDVNFFRRHIIDADPDKVGLFYNLNGEEVSCCEHLLTLSPVSSSESVGVIVKQSNDNLKSLDASTFEPAKVLFEETFFTEDDCSYRLLCISQPLTVPKSQDFRQHDELSSTPVQNEVEKTEEAVNNLLKTFSIAENPGLAEPLDADANGNNKEVPSTSSSMPYSYTENQFSTAKFSAKGDEDTEYCMRVLFANEKDYRFETYLQKGCLLFAQKLAAKYERFWNVKTVVDAVYAEFQSISRLVLKRRKRQNGGKLHSREADCIKLATEIYFFHCIGRAVLSVLRGCLSDEESELNRERCAAEKLSPQDLAVNPVLFESIPTARKVIARLMKPMSPHSRLLCLRRAIVALNSAAPIKDQKHIIGRENEAAKILSSDDLLPALVFLVLKSSSITDWTTNLTYMSEFHFSKASGDELGYCLASFEAAAEYIRNRSLRKISVLCLLPKRSMNPMDLIMKTVSTSEETGSLKEYILAMVETNDDVGLMEFFQQQQEVDKYLQRREAELGLCHPLCFCEKCTKTREDVPYQEENLALALDVNSPLFQGRTALHYSAALSKSSLVQTLCKIGARVDPVDDEGLTPLNLACQVGCQSCVILLLHMGARLDIPDRQGNMALHTAANFGFIDCVKALLYFDQHIRGSKMKVNSPNDHGDTPLHLAVKLHHIEIAAVLLECGAMAKIRNCSGKTAADICDNTLIQYLLLKEDPGLDFIMVEKRGAVGSTLSMAEMASIISDEDEYQSVKSQPSADSDDDESNYLSPTENFNFKMEAFANNKIDRLLRAVADNDLPMMKYFIGNANISARDNKEIQNKLCHPLCQCEKCHKIHESMVDMVDVNEPGSLGKAAVHIATERGNIDVLRTLIRLGANVNLQEKNHNETALHIASKEAKSDVVEILIVEGGASLQVTNSNGDTPLHLAAKKGLVAVVQKLCELGADVHTANVIGDTPLHQAVKYDRRLVIEDLLGWGASVFACNNMRLTPLDLARNSETRKLLNRYAHR